LLGSKQQGIFTASRDCRFKYGPWKFGPPYGLIIPIEGNIDQTSLRAVSTFMTELGYLEIFTSPLMPIETKQFIEFGYTIEETLVLMKRTFDFPLQNEKKFRTHKIRQKDLVEILKIDHASFDTFWQWDKNAFLNAKKATPYVRLRMIKKNNQIAAYAITGAGIKDGFIQRLAVFPDFQNCGFGTQLLNDGLHWLHRKGVSNIWVNTQPTNQAAINLYRKTNFEICEDELSVLRFFSGIRM